jgi:hypothetical protein
MCTETDQKQVVQQNLVLTLRVNVLSVHFRSERTYKIKPMRINRWVEVGVTDFPCYTLHCLKFKVKLALSDISRWHICDVGSLSVCLSAVRPHLISAGHGSRNVNK